MIRQSSALSRPRRRLVFMLLALIMIVTLSVGGVVLWLRLHAPVYQHVPNALNTGASALYLTSPGFESASSQLTMVRTRDGATLWQYSLPQRGTLSTGYSPSVDTAQAYGEAVAIANGVAYFVVDPDYQAGTDREQELTALRAADGALLWRRPVQGATVKLLSVSDGVVCLHITQQQGSKVTSSALAGYDARTGALDWQRQGSDVTGSPVIGNGVYLLDGVLYVTGSVSISNSTRTLYALLARTGKTLWQYTPPAPSRAHTGQFLASSIALVAADEGVVVAGILESGGSLIGVRERDGIELWQYQTPNILTTVPHGGTNAPGILEQGGVLYFGTTVEGMGLQLTSLQVTTGHLLWREAVGTSNLVLWDLVVGGGSVYALIVPDWVGLHPKFDGLVLTALDARDGTLRWQQHPVEETFPYVAATGDTVVLASQTDLAGLDAADGATLWRIGERDAPSSITAVADGTDFVSSVTVSGAETWAATLCSVQQSTGTTLWCDHFVSGLAAVVLGP